MARWSKISVVGAGQIGGSLAQRLAEADFAEELVVTDVVEGLPQGKALDIEESAPILEFSTKVWGSTDMKSIAGSDLVVLTAGLARKPGMSRSDLNAKNAVIIKSHAEAIRDYAPKAIVVVVTNPVDVMAWLVKKITGFPRERVIGESGTLDSARFRLFVAREVGVAPRDVVGFVMGSHGDTMVPILSHCSVNGMPLRQLVSEEKIASIVKRTKGGGGEIVALLKTGSAYYAPSASQFEMIRAIARNEHRLVTSSAYLDGEFGLKDLYLSVPTVLGSKGLERILPVELTADEKAQLEVSGKAVRTDIDILNSLPQ